MVGTTFGRYQVLQEIGRGGMGVVYCARDVRLDRLVALKLLAQNLRSHPSGWGFIMREAQIASALNHPSICIIFDVGEEDQQPYIAMEYIEGDSLGALLMPAGLSHPMIAFVARLIVSALAYTHERGIIHRDIKSSNIIVTHRGDLKILDFGLAKRIRTRFTGDAPSSHTWSTEFESLVGTVSYLAPEVLRGERASVWTDIWSFGVLLFEMSTGKLPFEGKTVFELATAIMTSPLVLPDGKIPAWATQVISRCLERDLSPRYLCMTDILRDIPGDGPSTGGDNMDRRSVSIGG